MNNKVSRAIITIIFAIIGASAASFTLESKVVASFDSSVMLWLPAATYACFIIVLGLIGYFLSPLLIKAYKAIISKLMSYFSDIPLAKIFVGVIGLIIGLFIAFLLSYLPLRVEPRFIGVILCILMYIVFGSIGWLIPTKRFKEISLPKWFKSGDKHSKNTAVNKVLDTSAIIDGRFFDVFKTGIVEGNIIIPQFVLDELRLIADSPDPVKRTRGRRGLELLDRIRESDENQTIVIENIDYSDLADVDAKLMRYAFEKHACIVTNDYNLNKAASVNRLAVFNINDLANALKTNVTAGEEIVVSIIKEGKEHTQGVAYFDDGTMVVIEGGSELIGQTVAATVTSVLQTSAGKMVFAKLK